MQTFKEFYSVPRPPTDQVKKSNLLDTIQMALDVAGFEPTIGTSADAANVVISGLRAAVAKETNEKKKHLINAGISAISLIPFADLIKVIKLRHMSKPLTRAAIRGARASHLYAKNIKRQDKRHNS